MRFRVFLDTSVLFSAVCSDRGASRELLRLAEAGLINVWVSERVLDEAEQVLDGKLPEAKPYLAVILRYARVRVAPRPPEAGVRRWEKVVGCRADAEILAAAVAADCDALATFDRSHLLREEVRRRTPLAVGTAGDVLRLWRRRLLAEAGN